jgi:hypothetical protein
LDADPVEEIDQPFPGYKLLYLAIDGNARHRTRTLRERLTFFDSPEYAWVAQIVFGLFVFGLLRVDAV